MKVPDFSLVSILPALLEQKIQFIWRCCFYIIRSMVMPLYAFSAWHILFCIFPSLNYFCPATITPLMNHRAKPWAPLKSLINQILLHGCPTLNDTFLAIYGYVKARLLNRIKWGKKGWESKDGCGTDGSMLSGKKQINKRHLMRVAAHFSPGWAPDNVTHGSLPLAVWKAAPPELLEQ